MCTVSIRPGAPVAGDGVAGDEVLDQRLGVLGEPPERMGIIAAELRFEPVLVPPLSRMELPAIPSRGAPSDALGLDQHDVDIGFGEMQGGRQTGVAAPDDRDIRLHRLIEGREGEIEIGGRGVERGSVPAGLGRCRGHRVTGALGYSAAGSRAAPLPETAVTATPAGAAAPGSLPSAPSAGTGAGRARRERTRRQAFASGRKYRPLHFVANIFRQSFARPVADFQLRQRFANRPISAHQFVQTARPSGHFVDEKVDVGVRSGLTAGMGTKR